MFKMMKVFDCQHMPNDVRVVFFNSTEEAGNDSVIQHTVESEYYEDENYHLVNNTYHTIVDTWLRENGAEENETVMIKHWW